MFIRQEPFLLKPFIILSTFFFRHLKCTHLLIWPNCFSENIKVTTPKQVPPVTYIPGGPPQSPSSPSGPSGGEPGGPSGDSQNTPPIRANIVHTQNCILGEYQGHLVMAHCKQTQNNMPSGVSVKIQMVIWDSVVYSVAGCRYRQVEIQAPKLNTETCSMHHSRSISNTVVKCLKLE